MGKKRPVNRLCWHRQVLGGRQNPAAARTVYLPLNQSYAIGIRLAPPGGGGAAMVDRLAGSIERYLYLLSARQKLVVSNIANADTPGYKTRDLDFQSEYRSAIETAQPQAIEVDGLKVKNDGNNVSLDREARLLAENALRFNLASQFMRSEMRLVRSAIQEGRNG